VQNVCTTCVDCEKPLTDEEISKNKAYDNYYYTICSECVDRAKQRVMDIMSE